MNTPYNGDLIENTDEKLKNPNQTLSASPALLTNGYNGELQYPKDELEKWKNYLILMRSKPNNTYEEGRSSPLRRPKNNKPLHGVFVDMMNEDSFSSLSDEEDVDGKYSKYYIHCHKLENIFSSHTLNSFKATSKSEQQSTSLKNHDNVKHTKPSGNKIRTVSTNDLLKLKMVNAKWTDEIDENLLKISSTLL